MWQSHILLRSETLLMCPQGPFQLAAPHSCSCGWKVPSTHLGMGLVQGSTWPLATQLRLESAAYLSLPPAFMGLGTMMWWLSPEAELGGGTHRFKG